MLTKEELNNIVLYKNKQNQISNKLSEISEIESNEDFEDMNLHVTNFGETKPLIDFFELTKNYDFTRSLIEDVISETKEQLRREFGGYERQIQEILLSDAVRQGTTIAVINGQEEKHEDKKPD